MSKADYGTALLLKVKIVNAQVVMSWILLLYLSCRCGHELSEHAQPELYILVTSRVSSVCYPVSVVCVSCYSQFLRYWLKTLLRRFCYLGAHRGCLPSRLWWRRLSIYWVREDKPPYCYPTHSSLFFIGGSKTTPHTDYTPFIWN